MSGWSVGSPQEQVGTTRSVECGGSPPLYYPQASLRGVRQRSTNNQSSHIAITWLEQRLVVAASSVHVLPGILERQTQVVPDHCLGCLIANCLCEVERLSVVLDRSRQIARFAIHDAMESSCPTDQTGITETAGAGKRLCRGCHSSLGPRCVVVPLRNEKQCLDSVRRQSGGRKLAERSLRLRKELSPIRRGVR